MNGDSFELDLWAFFLSLAFGVAVFLLWRFLRARPKPKIFFSNLRDLTLLEGKRSRLARLPFYLLVASMVLFLVAFANPRLIVPRSSNLKKSISSKLPPRKGIAIYLVVDHSGSMAHHVQVSTPSGGLERMSKLDLLKQVTRQFILGDASAGLKGRPYDMIGLIEFARGANVLTPLTLDHQAVLRQLNKISVVQKRDQNGTAIGYALYKTTNLIEATRYFGQELVKKGKPAYEIQSSVIVLITDGFQSPNPLDQDNRFRSMDMEEAGAFARKEGVRIYIVNVEPEMASEKYAAYRKIEQQVAEMTGGKFFLVDSSMDLGKIYQDIDHLEKSTLPQQLIAQIPKSMLPDLYRTIYFYPYLIGSGMGTLFFAVFLSATWLRRVP